MNKGMRAAIIAVVGVALAACATAQRASVKQTIADAGRALTAGDYQGTIDLYQKASAADGAGQKVVTGYVRAVEDIKRAADRTLGLGRFVPAASTYGVLLRNWPGFSRIAGRLSFGKSDVLAGLRSCRAGTCDAQARQELAAGNYDKPVALYQAALKDYPGDPALKAGYAATVRKIEDAAAKAFARNDHAVAGKVYRIMLTNLAAFEACGIAAGLDRAALEAGLKACSANLTSRGLEEYRKGDLVKAISVWENLLAFEPGNAEIKKAVETARAQLGKLRTAPPPGRSPVSQRSRAGAGY